MQRPALTFDMRRFFLKKKIDRYSRTLPSLPTIPVAVSTDIIPVPAVDKTARLCSMINMLVRNKFAVITIRFGMDDYSVVYTKSVDGGILVYFLDFAGKCWSTLVSEFNAFSIFRGA